MSGDKRETNKNNIMGKLILVTIKNSRFEEFITEVSSKLNINSEPNYFDETYQGQCSMIYRVDEYEELILKGIADKYTPVNKY